MSKEERSDGTYLKDKGFIKQRSPSSLDSVSSQPRVYRLIAAYECNYLMRFVQSNKVFNVNEDHFIKNKRLGCLSLSIKVAGEQK